MPPTKKYNHTISPTVVPVDDAEFVEFLRKRMSEKMSRRVNTSDALRECLDALMRDGTHFDHIATSKEMRLVATERLQPFQVTTDRYDFIRSMQFEYDMTTAQIMRAAIEVKKKEVYEKK